MKYRHKKLIYLAGPITPPKDKPELYLERIRAHARCAVHLQSRGEVDIYSPASETHGFVELGGMSGTTWEDWRGKDLNQLSRCDEIYVMLLDGWKESLGVRGEVKYALKNNIPVSFVTVDGQDIVRTNTLEMFEVKSADDLND